jgi:hypothetical protein
MVGDGTQMLHRPSGSASSLWAQRWRTFARRLSRAWRAGVGDHKRLGGQVSELQSKKRGSIRSRTLPQEEASLGARIAFGPTLHLNFLSVLLIGHARSPARRSPNSSISAGRSADTVPATGPTVPPSCKLNQRNPREGMVARITSDRAGGCRAEVLDLATSNEVID